MITYAEALDRLISIGEQHRLPAERLAIDRALNRICVDELRARVDLPGFDNAAMDGFAIHADDAQVGRILPVMAEQWAGQLPGSELSPGQCIRITTGAAVPSNADQVVPKENVSVEDAAIRLRELGPGGAHIRRRGEDIAAGDLLYAAGQRLGPMQLAALAACGIDAVNVVRLPRVAILTTGDELREPGESLAPGQIYDSNRSYLLSALSAEGLQPTAWPRAADDAATLRANLMQLSEVFDVVLCCGGVSAGERDLLPGLLAEHGRVEFWKVRMKPGMPFLFGQLGAAWVCGLPGNPVSVLATYQQLVLPLLNALRGQTAQPRRIPARLNTGFHKRHARLEFLRGRVWIDAQGQCWVEPHPVTGSHRLVAAAACNALLMLDESPAEYAAGDTVTVTPIGEW